MKLFCRTGLVALALVVAGCSTQPVTNQHPAWACNSSYLGPLGGAVASLITMNPTSIVTAVTIAVNACEAEASLVNGQPQQVTQTTATVQGTTKTP